MERLGCFAIVLEKIPSKLAKIVADELHIPVIGIGAGSGVDGQVLVLHDMLGMTHEFNPRFLRRYMGLFESMTNAIGQYIFGYKIFRISKQGGTILIHVTNCNRCIQHTATLRR